MIAVTRLFNDAEIAAAAYADLLSGPMGNDLNRIALSAVPCIFLATDPTGRPHECL